MRATALMPEGSYSSYLMDYQKPKPSTRQQNEFLRAVHPFYPDGTRVDRRTLDDGNTRSLLLTLVSARREYPRGVRFVTAEMIRNAKRISPLLRGLSLPREKKKGENLAGKAALLISSLALLCLSALVLASFRNPGSAAEPIAEPIAEVVAPDESASTRKPPYADATPADRAAQSETFSALFNSAIRAAALHKGTVRELSFSRGERPLMKARYEIINAADALAEFAEDENGVIMASGEIRWNGGIAEAHVELSVRGAALELQGQDAIRPDAIAADAIPAAERARRNLSDVERLARAPGRHPLSVRTANGNTQFLLGMEIEENALTLFFADLANAYRDAGMRVESFVIRKKPTDDSLFCIDAELRAETETALHPTPLPPEDMIRKAFASKKKSANKPAGLAVRTEAADEVEGTIIGNIEEEDGSRWIFTRLGDGTVRERLASSEKEILK